MGSSFDEIKVLLAASLLEDESGSWTSPGTSVFTFGTKNLGALRDSLDRAVIALEKEDRWLNRAFAASEFHKGYGERAALGLAYWVFEHNLVFAIFREWIKTHRVLWDETAEARWRVPATAEKPQAISEQGASARNRKRYIDLQLLHGPRSQKRTLFEAKWANTPKSRWLGKRDLEKLRIACRGRSGWNGYALLMVFGSIADLRRRIDNVTTDHGDGPCFVGVFPSRVRPSLRNDEGWFALLAVKVV